MSTLFLEPDEIKQLTGRRMKSLQVAWLKKQGLPFRINATGHPVVTRSVIEGKPTEPPPTNMWAPRAIAGA